MVRVVSKKKREERNEKKNLRSLKRTFEMLRRLIETQYFVPSLHIHQERKIYRRMDDGD